MELQQVVSIVESLANGVDPGSGAPIAFHSPDVPQALTAAAGILRTREGNRPAAAGQRWSEDEDALLCHEFDGGTPIADIAKQHGRSRGAITLRLVKLGRIEEESVKLRQR
jgi:hypothetical protein